MMMPYFEFMALMKRSVLMAILLSLFMFQSLWNVAAAFCAHENTSKNPVIVYHFGHHIDTTLGQQTAAHNDSTPAHQKIKTTVGHVPSVFIDHHDHLPSCLHIVVAEIGKSAQEPPRSGYLTRSIYDWANSYQSPHLSGFNPPPVLAPL